MGQQLLEEVRKLKEACKAKDEALQTKKEDGKAKDAALWREKERLIAKDKAAILLKELEECTQFERDRFEDERNDRHSRLEDVAGVAKGLLEFARLPANLNDEFAKYLETIVPP